MDLTQHAQFLAVGVHSGAPAGVIGGVLVLCLEGDVLCTDAVQDGFHRALQGEEGLVGAIEAQGEDLGLVGHAVLFFKIGAAQLIEIGGLIAEVIVPGKNLQHGGQNRSAHDGGVLAQGVADAQGLAQGGVLRQADLVVIGGADEGVGDDLVIAQAAADGPQVPLQHLLPAVAALGGDAPHGGGGNLVVAEEPSHLFCQVGVVLHVSAPGGNGDIVSVHAEAQVSEDAAHLRGVNVGAQQGVDLLRAQLQGLGLGHEVQNVDDPVQHLAGAQHLHQLAGPVDGGEGVQDIQTLFELGGSLGAHAQGQRALSDAGAVKVGGLKDHVHGVVYDLAVLAAHDACQAHSPGLIGNDQVVVGQLAHVAVQGGELLALLGPADDDLSALHIAVVKGVHGLAVFQHHVVGDVHDVVDGAHAGGAQPLPHPLGGGADLHVADHPGGVPGAQILGGGFHVQQICQVAGAAALHHGLVKGEGLAVGHSSLPGQTDDGQAVRAVGSDLKLHHVVIQVQSLPDIVAGL